MVEFAKDFFLDELLLTNAQGQQLELRWVMFELNIYEDIFTNNTTCDLVINDANNLLMNYPIFGQETLQVSFTTPNKEQYTKKFRLTHITDQKLIKEREQTYILHFVTPESILNLKTRVSKSYKGMLISDVVGDVHTNLLGGGPIFIEATKYLHHIIIPDWAPAFAINWCCTRAVSANHQGAFYLYYEDKYQFNFISVETLLAKPIQQTYLWQPDNIWDSPYSGPSPTDILAAESYEFENHSAILENMATGMYGSEMLTIDPIRKHWKRYTFDYPTSFQNYQHLYPNPLYSTGYGDEASPNNILKFQPTGSDPYPFHPENWLQIRMSQLQQLHALGMKVTLPGDSSRTVGQVVQFDLPSPEPPIGQQQVYDKYLQGKFLVTSVRHTIRDSSYITVCNLQKDSVPVAYP